MLTPNDTYLEKPIIVIGSGRSGTTIISEIIFQHEDLAWHSNYQEIFVFTPLINLVRRIFDNRFWRLKNFYKYVGRSKKNTSVIDLLLFNPIERYNFWEYITGKRIDFARGFLLNEKATEDETRRIRSFLSKQVKYQHRKRLIMKFTGPARLEYLSSIFPDAIIVNVIRDPVTTVRSLLAVNFWKRMGIDKLWWRGAYTKNEIAYAETIKNKPALITAFQYKKIRETTQQEIKKLKLNVYECRYEDFVKDPVNFVNLLMQFMQLPESKNVNAYLKRVVIKDPDESNNDSKQEPFSELLKQQVLEITGGY